MRSTGDDVFSSIHALLRRRRIGAALAALLDAQGRLRPAYRCDANHAWYLVGDARCRLGDRPAALMAFRRSLSCWRQDYQAMWAMGDCWFALGRPLLALRWFRRAFDTSGDAGVGYNLANVLFDCGRLEDALALYDALRTQDVDLARVIRLNAALVRKRLREGQTKKGQGFPDR